MEQSELLQKITASFKRYYDVKWEDVKEPFVAEAEFHSHDEQFFLVKSAKLFESESTEYVFFATVDTLDMEQFLLLDNTAWEEGLSRAKPQEGHKNTDVVLIILAEHIDDDVFCAIKKQRHYKSYHFGLYGWSQYRLTALELSSKRVVCNRQGQDLKKLIANIQREL